MELILIPLVALLASVLTFFSGFGLGTLLLPAFAAFFPTSLAVAAIAAWQGAHVIRAHDVAATKRVLRMVDAIRSA